MFPATVDRVVALFSVLVFIGGTALLAWLAEPPGVIVAIIAVAAVGVLLSCLLPRGVHSRSTGPIWLAHAPVSPPAEDGAAA